MGFIKRYKWHKVADNSANLNLPAGNIIRVEVDGKPICLGRFKEQLYGFAAECPHAGADMTDGYIDGSCRVVCAVHSLKFDLRNGLDANGEGYKLKTYPVEVREDGIYVGIEEGSKFKWF
jgi:nitrite reductase/ring-hydroxylating ferredoxin subunit